MVGNILQALQHPYKRWMTILQSHGCKLIACNKIVGFKKTYTAKADNCHKLGQLVIYYCLLLSVLQLTINALFKTNNAALITINVTIPLKIRMKR